jgi:hypothetical protein
MMTVGAIYNPAISRIAQAIADGPPVDPKALASKSLGFLGRVKHAVTGDVYNWLEKLNDRSNRLENVAKGLGEDLSKAERRQLYWGGGGLLAGIAATNQLGGNAEKDRQIAERDNTIKRLEERLKSLEAQPRR